MRSPRDALPPFRAPPDPDEGTALPEIRAPLPGPIGQALIDVLARHECPAITARRKRRSETTGVDQDPIVWDRARGANVWDPDGNRYVDLTAGFGVAAAGHGNPWIRRAAHEQIDRLVHGLGDAFPSRVRIELSEALARHLPGDLSQVIFGTSGSEAVEAAVKTAVIGTGRRRVVAFEGSYHGLGLGILPATHHKEDFRAPFSRLFGDWVTFLPWCADEDLVDGALRSGDVAAVLVEPIQGRGGDRVPPPGWLGGLRRLCDRYGTRLIYDEIFTGLGRTGSMTRAEVERVHPDLICLGKGLGGGFPLSACVGTEAAMRGWGTSRGEALHTSTFLGHPVGCAAGLATFQLIDEGGLFERAAELGREMEAGLDALVRDHPAIFAEQRGVGCMRGLVLRDPGRAFPLCRGMLGRGFLLLPAGVQGEALSFTPPLTTTLAQWTAAMDALRGLL